MGRRTLFFLRGLLGGRKEGLVNTFWTGHFCYGEARIRRWKAVSACMDLTCRRCLVPRFRHAWLRLLRRCLGTGLHHCQPGGGLVVDMPTFFCRGSSGVRRDDRITTPQTVRVYVGTVVTDTIGEQEDEKVESRK